ncbi:acyl carrier protein [Actinokineospora sp. PR83]|uniref:acyl carrier protein n=1 Tax=Actinokineospora sp. PR83 TaxID=2884908 RepID=UPI0027E0DAF8|nr:acyl carrier protein [Actinokineospora sp. PR83]MCG8914480.1 acyl carrier protein [Actinokineospora sp. PR83]
MDHEQVRAMVERFIRELDPGAAPELDPGATFDDLGVDSLSLVDLLFKLERTFDVSIPDEALPGITTVGDLVDYVASAS